MNVEIKELNDLGKINYNNAIKLLMAKDENGKVLQSIGFGKNTTKNDSFKWELLYAEHDDLRYFEDIFECFKNNFSTYNVFNCVIYKENFNEIKVDLSKCGFVEYEDRYSDIGCTILYKITDLDNGKFYIGVTQSQANWDNGYMGSGGAKWFNNINKYPNITSEPDNKNAHHYKREIVASGFNTPNELFEAEVELIIENIDNFLCCNTKTLKQNNFYILKDHRCPECGGKRLHYSTCSQFKSFECPECKGKNGHHYKGCIYYKAHAKADPCPECGVVYGHKKTCSKANKCPECGASQGKHTKNCSHYKEIVCPECGLKSYNHKKTCSHYKDHTKPCPECGGLRGHHRIGCSQYTPDSLAEPCPECGSRKGHKKTCSHAKKCSECGSTHGKHKSTCSHYKDPGKCPECGYSLQSRRHANTCSHYKAPKAAAPCPECGGTRGHFKTCSKYKQSKKVCEECGGIAGNHKSFCSKRKKSEPCPECGAKRGHKKTCSKFKQSECPECGGKGGHHMKGCSKY